MNSTSDDNGKSTRHRWRRFVVQGVVIATICGVLVTAWLVTRVYTADRQRRAIAAIKQLGGDVAYDWQDRGTAPWAPPWLRATFGEDFFSTVGAVILSGSKANDLDISHLARLTGMYLLALDRTSVSDSDLHHLRSLINMKVLCLQETNVSDVGLQYIRSMSKLERLNLSNTKVGDDGLANLEGMMCLSELDLENTRVTDVGLKHLQGLTALQTLHLEGTRVSVKGLLALHRALPRTSLGVPPHLSDQFLSQMLEIDKASTAIRNEKPTGGRLEPGQPGTDPAALLPPPITQSSVK